MLIRYLYVSFAFFREELNKVYLNLLKKKSGSGRENAYRCLKGDQLVSLSEQFVKANAADTTKRDKKQLKEYGVEEMIDLNELEQ